MSNPITIPILKKIPSVMKVIEASQYSLTSGILCTLFISIINCNVVKNNLYLLNSLKHTIS